MPTYVPQEVMSLITTAPAPITVLSLIEILSIRVVPAPIKTFSLTVTFPHIVELGPINEPLPILHS